MSRTTNSTIILVAVPQPMFRRVYGYVHRVAPGAIDFLAECKAVACGVFVMPLRRASDARRATELDRLPDALLRDIGVKRDRS